MVAEVRMFFFIVMIIHAVFEGYVLYVGVLRVLFLVL